MISSDKGAENSTILVPIQVNGTKRPLFFVPGSFGDVLYFSPLSQSLGEDQPVYGLQPIGLDGIAQPIDHIERMAEFYIQSMQSIQESGPYRIGGHSFGGLVAFEMCRQLEIRGETIESLLLFDSSPRNLLSEGHFNEPEQFIAYIRQILKLYDVRSETDINEIKNLDEQERWEFIRQLLEKNDVPLPLNMIKGKWNVNRTNCQMRSSPQTQLSLDHVIVFRAGNEKHQESDLGWSDYISSEIKVYAINGNHFSMLEDPNVREIAQVLWALERPL